MRTLAPLLIAALLAQSACAVEDDAVVTDEATLPDDDAGDSKADAANELTVRAGETTLWASKAIVRDTRDGADGLVLRGRTSRNLTDGFGFVFDDPYGAFAIRSARTFEVRWTTSELASLLIGVDQFINLQFVHSATRPDALTARAVARARMTGFTGSGAYLFVDVTPVVSGGRTVLRVRGSSPSDLLEVTAAVGATALDAVAITDPRHFQIDLPLDTAIALAGSTADLAVTTRTASGTRIKRGKLVVVVKQLGLTTGDAYEVWPRGDCADEVRACLASQPSDTCGEALEVLACGGAATVTATAADGDAAILVGEPGFVALRADGAALVGTTRVDALVAGARDAVAARVGDLVGTVYPSAAGRDAALAAAVAAGLDEAYAYPLAHVPALVPLANNPGRSREIAADALLQHLAALDLVHTEFGRSYVELCRVFRPRHVASIRGFRLEGTPQDIPGWPPYLFIGNWLDAYVEISVDQATGVATSVLFEID